MRIGKQILALRKKEGLSQEKFGELFHVTRQTVSNWENEKSYPDLQVLVQISEMFSVSLDTLIKDNPDMVKAIDKERELGVIKHQKAMIDMFTGAGTGIIASCLFSPDSPRRWIRIGIGAYFSMHSLSEKELDCRLFDKQIEYFKNKYNVFVWDAPGHASSWPFRLEFSLRDKAKWLHEIMMEENITKLVIVGQSMGGYIGQMYAELYLPELLGFVSIDSAPLQRKYVTGVELWLLKRMEPVYRHYPWNLLLKSGTNGVAMSEYGRRLMKDMMLVYDGDQERYAKLSGHGFKILAEAMEADLKYTLPEHSLLICGDKDKAGSCIRYNRAWHKKTGIRLEWIEGAGYNSNTDNPEKINSLIEELVDSIK